MLPEVVPEDGDIARPLFEFILPEDDEPLPFELLFNAVPALTPLEP